MIILETKRLLLRNYQLADIPDIFEYFSNEDVARFEDFHPMSLEEVTEEITEWVSMDNRLAVVLKVSNKVIGSVGYWIDEDGDYSIDFDFNPIFAKKGYATEAVTKLLHYLFHTIRIPKIYGDCDIRNINSYRLLERLGFTRIKQLDNQSYKEDRNGNPMLISIYLYEMNNNITREADIIESDIGLDVSIDKYTRVEYSKLGNHIKLERNNQIVYSTIGKHII